MSEVMKSRLNSLRSDGEIVELLVYMGGKLKFTIVGILRGHPSIENGYMIVLHPSIENGYMIVRGSTPLATFTFDEITSVNYATRTIMLRIPTVEDHYTQFMPGTRFRNSADQVVLSVTETKLVGNGLMITFNYRGGLHTRDLPFFKSMLEILDLEQLPLTWD